ncbi:MAG TPA: hypothetical protein VFG76_03085, partial [Candidatus Polarisedimenticolia bacterium]|nr:hypothetical protein [Candidatus Polarisedimenticolia bacterium]
TRTALGLGYKFTEEIHGFARQELDHADAGDASRTVVGMESRIARNTVMESRYSLEDSLNGARGFAHLGLRSRLPLNQDWLGDFNLERVTTTQGLDTGDFSALGVGFEYLPARVKFTTRYELRLGDREDRHAITTAGATRLTDSVSVFTRERLFLVNPEDDRARLDGDGLVGLAYRPVSTDKLNFLVKLQGLKGDGASGAGSVQARSYLGIFETNYEPVARLHVLGRVAMKESRDSLEGDSFMSRTWLAEARGLVDIGQRFNAGLSARFMNQITGRSTVTGFGLESGFRAMKDMWVIGGYNLTGFKENGFGDTDRRSAGPFLSVRFKFDEETVLGLAKKMSASGPDPASAVP